MKLTISSYLLLTEETLSLNKKNIFHGRVIKNSNLEVKCGREGWKKVTQLPELQYMEKASITSRDFYMKLFNRQGS